jgi:hypothetical protein
VTSAGRPDPTERPATAVGWATVELDRAAVELRPLLEPGSSFAPATDCTVLGARCRVGRARDGAVDAPIIVLLEPSTEGRLTAVLARRGEGWCARWAIGTDVAGSRWSSGPLGSERLATDRAADGSFQLLVRPATIVR